MPNRPASTLRLELSTPPASQRYTSSPRTPEMSESVPFLLAHNTRDSPYGQQPSTANSRTSFSSPLASPSLRPSSPYEDSRTWTPPGSPMLSSAMAVPAAVTRRSRTRLFLLCILAVLGFSALIGSINAPDHVKAQAYDIVQTVHASVKGSLSNVHADEIWQGAKEWSGWGSKDPEGFKEDEQQDLATSLHQDMQSDEEALSQDVDQQNNEEEQVIATEDDSSSSQDNEDSESPSEQAQQTQQTGSDDGAPSDPTEAQSEQTEKEAFEVTVSADEAGPTTTERPVPIAPAFSIPTKIATSEAQPASGQLEKIVHPIYVLPDPPRVPKGGPEEQFFSYLPHSGFHNQRIELANAMTLASMLNRTLLLPPVWIGWPSSTQPYKKMQQVWDREMREHPDGFRMKDSHNKLAKRQAKKLSEDECKSYAKECKSTYQDTFVAWSFLTDMDLAETRLPLIDRFNMSEAFAKEITGATGKDDVYLLEDTEKYFYTFEDTDFKGDMIQKTNGGKYVNRVSVPRLREATANNKIIMMGSMFGSGRLTLKESVNQRNLLFFHRTLAFRNPILERPANTIRDLMGGPRGYAGIHARVGDGGFKAAAAGNMDLTFQKLMGKLQVDPLLVPDMLAKGKARSDRLKAEAKAALSNKRSQKVHRSKKSKRSSLFVNQQENSESSWTVLDDLAEGDTPEFNLPLSNSHNSLVRRQQSHILGPIEDRDDSPLSKTLTCRGELYKDPRFLALNNPVYLATDSAHPLSDPVLSNYWANLPCLFILADFDRYGPQNSGEPVDSLRYMEGAVNENDGVKLGRLFLPFMEAAVAAKATVTVGTLGSTFSGFAAGFLHDAYADDVAFASGDD